MPDLHDALAAVVAGDEPRYPLTVAADHDGLVVLVLPGFRYFLRPGEARKLAAAVAMCADEAER